MIINERCKICKSPLRSEIEKLLVSGNTVKYVVEYCQDRNFPISSTSIHRHMLNHYRSEYGEYQPVTKRDDILIDTDIYQVESHDRLLEKETYEEFQKRFNLRNIDKLKNIKDYEKTYTTYLKILSEIIYKTMYVISRDIDKTQDYEMKYPESKIKSLKLLFDIQEKIYPISSVLNLNVAIEMLHKEGYEVIMK
jgi:hypothetical protein